MPRPITLAAALFAATASLVASDDPRARALYGEVIAPCCWSQPVSVHQSPAAEEVRGVISQRVRDGWSDQRIKDALVAEYGVRVLARPPARGFTWALYVTPWIALVGSAGGLWVLLRRFASRRPTVGIDAAARPDVVSDERLDDELRDLD